MAVVSHDYDFIDAVCTDITHYDNNGVLGTPCKFNYYPMTFGQFQTLKPEIAAGLPRADHGVATTAPCTYSARVYRRFREGSQTEDAAGSPPTETV